MRGMKFDALFLLCWLFLFCFRVILGFSVAATKKKKKNN